MDTVWERLGGKELSLPLLLPIYFLDFSSLQLMPCSLKNEWLNCSHPTLYHPGEAVRVDPKLRSVF
jgi:hypothetical protein